MPPLAISLKKMYCVNGVCAKKSDLSQKAVRPALLWCVSYLYVCRPIQQSQ